MEDSAMILRVKFKAIPGKQFTIRRELLHRIRAAFEEAGIRFGALSWRLIAGRSTE